MDVTGQTLWRQPNGAQHATMVQACSSSLLAGSLYSFVGNCLWGWSSTRAWIAAHSLMAGNMQARPLMEACTPMPGWHSLLGAKAKARKDTSLFLSLVRAMSWKKGRSPGSLITAGSAEVIDWQVVCQVKQPCCLQQGQRALQQVDVSSKAHQDVTGCCFHRNLHPPALTTKCSSRCISLASAWHAAALRAYKEG